MNINIPQQCLFKWERRICDLGGWVNLHTLYRHWSCTLFRILTGVNRSVVRVVSSRYDWVRVGSDFTWVFALSKLDPECWTQMQVFWRFLRGGWGRQVLCVCALPPRPPRRFHRCCQLSFIYFYKNLKKKDKFPAFWSICYLKNVLDIERENDLFLSTNK